MIGSRAVRRPVAIALVATLVMSTAACSSMQATRLTMTAPPPPDSDYEIVGMHTVEGDHIEFAGPATVELNDAGTSWLLTYETPFLDAEQSARIARQIAIEEVAAFEVDHMERKPDNVANVAAVVVAVAFILWARNPSNWW